MEHTQINTTRSKVVLSDDVLQISNWSMRLMTMDGTSNHLTCDRLEVSTTARRVVLPHPLHAMYPWLCKGKHTSILLLYATVDGTR